MTKKGARQGCIAIQPLHLRHGAGKGAGRGGVRRAGAQARGAQACGTARRGALAALRHGSLGLRHC